MSTRIKNRDAAELVSARKFEEEVKRWTLSVLLLLGSGVTLLIGLLGEQNTALFWNLGFSFFFFSLWAMLQYRKKLYPLDHFLLFSISISIPLVVLFKGRSNLDIVWFLVYPGLAYFLQGLKWGAIWTHWYLSLFVILMAGSMLGFWKAEYLSSDYYTVLLTGFLIQAIFLLYEIRRRRIEGDLRSLAEDLHDRVNQEIQKGKAQEFLIQQQSRLAAMGEMVRAIAHQWRQPLNATALIIQDLEEAYNGQELTKDYLNRSVTGVMEKVQYMSQTIDDFRKFITGSRERTRFQILPILEESIRLAEARLKHENIRLVRECVIDKSTYRQWDAKDLLFDSCWLVGPENQLKQIVLNLLNNSIDSIREQCQRENHSVSGEILMSVRKVTAENRTRLIIQDSGPGFPKADLERVLDPYFTTKPDGSGFGLYLSSNLMSLFPGELKIKANHEVQGGYVELTFFPEAHESVEE